MSWANEFHNKYLLDQPEGYPECERGWENLLIETFEKLNRLELPYEILQIKEKYGGLRIYAEIITPDEGWYKKIAQPGYQLTNKDKQFLNISENAYPETSKYIDKFHNILLEAEIKSMKICEYCGKPGELRDLSWIKTLCNDCYKGTK